ncbi:magnesium transporter CorA family protein [Stappia taiwanensis]|uniref:Magnesium transport protein CorA n=1 Tax=Stappia taiwanensis TaxID=992267 RepID=A0A838XLL7_9HYPH|nr:magnesium transporter CorA family protein [Stappia taiwanensis]MBA4612209.1 magnesium transporter CorA family protein [Stappia taiwanensis]GGE92744.1 magnesium transport protein CorA [Stappia taiwanensis]
MITAYCRRPTRLVQTSLGTDDQLPPDAIWVDLAAPTAEERAAVSSWIGVDLPTRDEMAAIETSERLYQEGNALVMTALMPMVSRDPDPTASSMTFVVTKERFVSIRHGEPSSIAIAARRLQGENANARTGADALLVLLDAVADRAADVIEEASAQFDKVSNLVFGGGLDSRKSSEYQGTIQKIGRIGLTVARMHDACATLERLFIYLATHARLVQLTGQQKAICKALGRDIRSVREHASALDAKLNFLLDATVGLVNLEQNQIIKIFSVLAVVFMPPTLIASIYGMNFTQMPELSWLYGYPFSLGVMLGSVLLTFLYFRWKKLL